MEYTDEFKQFVDTCIFPDGENCYVGVGNPNAKILIIGKESASSQNDADYMNNADEWKRHIHNCTCQKLEYQVLEDHPLRKGWGRNTWSKYQLLKECIFHENVPEPFYVDFLKNIFTTEINDSPSTKTASADKSGIAERKELLKKAAFIQRFPVVILACSGYIQNNNEVREIDDIFGVTYDGDEKGKYIYNKNNWFYTHHDTSRTKLVIHTRQLSADVINTMLEDMGKIICEHLRC